MEEKLGQSTAVLFKYEKLILAEEETTSSGRCGVSLAAFSRPASACLAEGCSCLDAGTDCREAEKPDSEHPEAG